MDSYHRCRRRRALPACLAVLCATTLGLATAAPAHAVRPAAAPTRSAGAKGDPRDDAKRADRAVDRAAAVLEDATARAQGAAKRLAAAVTRLPQAQQRVAVTRGKLAATTVMADTARRKADAAQAEYRTIAEASALAQRRVDTARQKVDDVVAAAYKGSTFVAINIIAAATGPTDVIDRMGYVDRVLQGQRAEVDELRVAQRQARQAQDESGLAKRNAESSERAAEIALSRSQAARDAAVEARADLLALAASRRAALAVARHERAATLARYRAAQAEEARIQDRLRAWEARQGRRLSTDGRLRMPVHGWKSSDFGMRLNPVYHIWRLHAGTDFAAAHGAPIHAAASGRVVNAGYTGGYGNYTCVSHGRYRGHGLSTCYGHQSHIGVRAGQWVTRGQVIGRVGTTGASTGNHLHFEVRLDGVPHNPLSYLPGCLC